MARGRRRPLLGGPGGTDSGPTGKPCSSFCSAARRGSLRGRSYPRGAQSVDGPMSGSGNGSCRSYALFSAYGNQVIAVGYRACSGPVHPPSRHKQPTQPYSTSIREMRISVMAIDGRRRAFCFMPGRHPDVIDHSRATEPARSHGLPGEHSHGCSISKPTSNSCRTATSVLRGTVRVNLPSCRISRFPWLMSLASAHQKKNGQLLLTGLFVVGMVPTASWPQGCEQPAGTAGRGTGHGWPTPHFFLRRIFFCAKG